MAAKKEQDEVKREAPPENYQGQVANQETTVRDAKVPEEAPDASSVAQVEEIKGE